MKGKIIAVVMIGVLALTIFGFSQSTQSTLASLVTPVEPTVILPENEKNLNPTIPVLTSNEEAKAVEIALNDARVKNLLEGKEYVIGKIGVMHTSELEKTGAALHICFDRPYQIEYDWPLGYCQSEQNGSSPSSNEVTLHYALPVQTLGILVDLENGRVLAIRPMDNDVGR